jgi:hypothetical protein
MQQDVITIQIKAVAINFEIRINDIPLFTMRKGRPTVTEIPCNHLLLSGVNEITVTTRPTADNDGYPEHTEAVFECYQRPIDALRTERKLIGKVNFPPSLSKPPIKTATLNESTRIKISNEAFNPLWSKAAVLEWDQEDLMEINNLYRQYEAALRKKDINEILKLTLEKDKHYANVFFSGLENQQQEQRDYYAALFEDKNFRLVPFENHNIYPLICGNNKIATLMNQDNRSPLQFYNRDEKITRSFPIFIGKVNKAFTILL